MSVDDHILEFIRDRFDALDKRMDQQDHVLADVRREVRVTNGRVTEIEKKGARHDGARSAFQWMPKVALAMTSGAGAAVATLALAGVFH